MAVEVVVVEGRAAMDAAVDVAMSTTTNIGTSYWD